MRRSSAATSDGQMDHGQVRKPGISRQKPVTWPDTAFGHLTGYVFVGQGGSNLATAWCVWRADWVRLVFEAHPRVPSPFRTERARPFWQLVDCLAGQCYDGLCLRSLSPAAVSRLTKFA